MNFYFQKIKNSRVHGLYRFFSSALITLLFLTLTACEDKVAMQEAIAKEKLEIMDLLQEISECSKKGESYYYISPNKSCNRFPENGIRVTNLEDQPELVCRSWKSSYTKDYLAICDVKGGAEFSGDQFDTSSFKVGGYCVRSRDECTSVEEGRRWASHGTDAYNVWKKNEAGGTCKATWSSQSSRVGRQTTIYSVDWRPESGPKYGNLTAQYSLFYLVDHPSEGRIWVNHIRLANIRC